MAVAFRDLALVRTCRSPQVVTHLRGCTDAGQTALRSVGKILDRGRSDYVASPLDINDDGVIVGSAFIGIAVVWSSPDSTMVRLDKFLKNSPFDSLSTAQAVSDSGEIVGRGWISDTKFGPTFLAIPK